MITNFLYCIDYPPLTAGYTETATLEGWLLCSRKIISVLSPNFESKYLINYGHARPDVVLHFGKFSNNIHCGFKISATVENINLKQPLPIKIIIEDEQGNPAELVLSFDMILSQIRSVEIDDEQQKNDILFKETESLFQKRLAKHPWLTIRMDITNKCNLRCIMCHYKEKEIYSRPTQAISAQDLKHKLNDIAPYVKHIMLSCGFEPLMSKYFHDILRMLHNDFPHIEIAMCTNGMLLNSKVRKSIIENNVSHVIFSLDGVTSQTVERIRVGAVFNKIIANILALKDIKKKHERFLPQLFMDFVLMNSNIHEAPAFVEMCSLLGISIIDFRHLVGNIFFNEHEEMLSKNTSKYNYYRPLIIEAAKKHNIIIRLPEQFETPDTYNVESNTTVDLNEFLKIKPAIETENIVPPKEYHGVNGTDVDFDFLSTASCLRPFNEIMIGENGKILPCSYYNDAMGWLDENNTLYNIFFNSNYQEVRRRKLLNRFDHNCVHCPIMNNLLPSKEIE